MRSVMLSFAALAAVACGVPNSPEGSSEGQSAQADERALVGAQHRLVLQNTGLTRLLYREATKGWLKWAMALPWTSGPIKDTTGAACAQGQQGAVWNLAGTSGGAVTRTCTVPANKLLFFPLVNRWVIPPAELVDTPQEVAELQALVDDYFPAARGETCTLTLRVDGHEVLADIAQRDQKLYVEVNQPFPLAMNADNFGSPGNPGGQMPAAWVSGHFALFLPLPPGQHTIELGGTMCDAEGVYFETSATYHLTVER